MTKLLLAALLVSLTFSFIASAGDAFGYDGRGQVGYSQSFSPKDWPADYRDLCEKHFNAVVGKCRSTYSNWFVTRLVNARVYGDTPQTYGLDDRIVGDNKCPYLENSDDAHLGFSATLTMACSSYDAGKVNGSSQYSCSFQCSGWSCDSGVDAFDVSGCTPATDRRGASDSFTWMTPGCQAQTRQLCTSRGNGCSLKNPCRMRNGVVYCKCSCADQPELPNFDDAAWNSRPRPAIDFDSFNMTAWMAERKDKCGGDKTVAYREPPRVADPIVEKKKIVDAFKSVPQTLLKLGGDGDYVVDVLGNGPQPKIYKVAVAGGQVGEVTVGSPAGAVVLEMKISEYGLRSIAASANPANAFKLGLKTGLVQVSSNDAFRNAALKVLVGAIDAQDLKDVASQSGTLVFFRFGGSQPVVQRASQPYPQALNEYGIPIGYFPPVAQDVLSRTSLPVSSKAGILPPNAAGNNLLFAPKTPKPPSVVLSGYFGSYASAAAYGSISAAQAYAGATSYYSALPSVTAYSRIGGVGSTSTFRG